MDAAPWTRRQVVLVALAQVVGSAIAFVAFWVAAFSLPEVGLFASDQSSGTRTWGAVAAVVLAASLPAGLWVAAAVRRSRGPANVGAAVAVVVLVAAAWYAQNG